MSLLMDALKQAEQNKNKGEASSSPEPDLPVQETYGPDAQDQSAPTPDTPLSREEDRAAIPAGEEADKAVMSLPPPPVDVTGADDGEEPLADELDFSEIEAAIAVEDSAADPDPPLAEPSSPIQPLHADEAVVDATLPPRTAPSLDSTTRASADGAPDGRSFAAREKEGVQHHEVPESTETMATAEDAARLIAAGSRRQSRARKRQFMLMGILLSVVLSMIGAYYYWSYQLHVQPVALPAPLAPVPLAAMEVPSQQVNAEQSPTAAQPESVIQPATAMPSQVQDTPRKAATVPRDGAPSSKPPARVQTVPPPREKPPARKTVKKPTVADKPAAVVIERHAEQPSTYQMLTMAYQAYREDRIQDARRLYEKVLDRQPRNRDALLGLASVAVRQGRKDEARALYRRQLEADPKDGVAQTGLLSLLSTGDPVANESLIKQMLREHGETPYLRFALGNVYAAQSRWEEAQQSYFRAYSAAPQNANYLFNLAVSLDHLHQDRMALQYYRWAVGQADGQAVKFDVEGARQRIRALTAAISGETS